MTDKNARTEAVKKLEAATEGSRELDARIYAAVLGPDWVAEISEVNGKWLAFCNTRFSDKHKRHRVVKAPREYTTSIDAALTLVPEGSEYEITTIYGPARVSLPLNGGEHMDCQVVERKDGNVPLAICTAALIAQHGGKP